MTPEFSFDEIRSCLRFVGGPIVAITDDGGGDPVFWAGKASINLINSRSEAESGPLDSIAELCRLKATEEKRGVAALKGA